MKKHEFNFDHWCRVATGAIRYGPDRKAASQELRGHLDDAFEAALARGLTEEEAENAVLESMGRAEDIRPQLAAIHKPFWGYVIQVSQIALLILLVLSLIPILKFSPMLLPKEPYSFWDFDMYDPASYGEDRGRVLHHLSKPEVSFRTEAGKFTVTDAAVLTKFPEGDNYSGTQLFVLMEQTSLLPATEHRAYLKSFGIGAYFAARDSLGNEYPCYWDPYEDDTPHVNAWNVTTGVFTCTYTLWINDFPQDAQWVELLYIRDGREHVLRIDLTGGDRT